jgi:hypothetical protein
MRTRVIVEQKKIPLDIKPLRLLRIVIFSIHFNISVYDAAVTIASCSRQYPIAGPLQSQNNSIITFPVGA